MDKSKRIDETDRRIRALESYLGGADVVDCFNHYQLFTKGGGCYIVVQDPSQIPEGRRELYQAEWLGCKDGYYIYRTLCPGQAMRRKHEKK